MEDFLILNISCGEKLYGPVLRLHDCVVISFASALFGFLLGVALGPSFNSKHSRIQEDSASASFPDLKADQPSAAEPSVSKGGWNSKDGEVLELKQGVAASRLPALDCKSPNLAQRCTPFANTLRNLSILSGLPHGLIEARGKDLEIVAIDGTVRQILGFAESTAETVLLYKTVHDLLPIELQNNHRRVVAKAVEDGDLPSSLMHPMRNIPMLRCDGSIVRVDLCVGVITKVRPRPGLSVTSLSRPCRILISCADTTSSPGDAAPQLGHDAQSRRRA